LRSNEERLLRAGLIRIYLVNPIKGLVGEMESDALLSIPGASTASRSDRRPLNGTNRDWPGKNGSRQKAWMRLTFS